MSFLSLKTSESDILQKQRQAFTKFKRQFKKSEITKELILDMAKEFNVEFVNMQFTDLFGIPKAVTMPIHKLEDALDRNVWFDGSSIEGFTRIYESDMYLMPDVSTFAILPWTVGTPRVTARIICDVYMPDGAPFSGDPRHILKRQLSKAYEMGYVFNTGPELEFFLFKKENGKLLPLPHDKAGYFDQTTDLAADVRADMSFALDAMGIEVEALHHEVAIGQHEIDFRYGDALQTADNAITFKMVLKAIADRHSLHATFMPKPIFGINGSGMHVHQSLFDKETGDTLFYDDNDKYHLSMTAKHFIAGQLHHVRAMNAVLNPIVNSYKRLVVGYEAPVYVSWAHTNRSALIRVPRFTQGQRKAARVELRCPDPAANPYLAFAAMIASGLAGIKNKMVPSDPVEEDIYLFDVEDLSKRKMTTVSENLFVAIQEMKKSDLMRDVMGEHALAKYYETKIKEWDDYRLSVSDWEIDKYLEIY